ncbi:MAG: alpha/beta hydrolase [Psychrobium sp.]|nr:alpha/beta hydrolase [Psychrobium sp.]
MKHVAIIFIFLLSGCAINITPQSFIYQSDEIEKELNLPDIQSSLSKSSTDATVSSISVSSKDGLLLNGIKLTHQQATVNIVLFGGNGMKISASSGILERFSMLPANVIWFDYRGTGVSEKTSILSIADLKLDALNVFDYAQGSFGNKLPTVIHGLSMGSLIASYVANERPADGLILDGAINSVPKLVDHLVPTWSKLFYTVNVSQELASINNVDLVKQYNKPLLFLIGEEDETTPVAFSQELYDVSSSAQKTLLIIPETGHAKTMKQEQAIAAYQLFIAKLR